MYFGPEVLAASENLRVCVLPDATLVFDSGGHMHVSVLLPRQGTTYGISLRIVHTHINVTRELSVRLSLSLSTPIAAGGLQDTINYYVVPK